MNATQHEPLTVPNPHTATDQMLIQTALKLARLQRDRKGLPPNLKGHLYRLHDELEARYPEVGPVMDRWAYSRAPMASYTEVLVGALPSKARGF